jgi:Zn-dependent protease with chaperone function
MLSLHLVDNAASPGLKCKSNGLAHGAQADSTGQSHQAWVAVPEPSPLALQYYRSGNLLWVADTVLTLLIPALLLFTGFSSRLRNAAFRAGRRWLPATVIYAACFVLVTALLGLPLAYYDGFVREHAYGLSNQSLTKWAGDWAKGVGLSAIGLALVLWIPYLLLRRSPRRWWLYAGLATLPIATLLLVIAPIWLDPLFNDFGAMKDRVLESRILELAQRAGISGSRVYQVNKSVDTKTVNAYVTGLGSTKRIVLWDTLLAKLEPDQVAFVMAHEMGHFVLHHVLAFILLATLLVTGSLYVVHLLAPKLIARFGRRFGFNQLSDLASFPLLLLLGGIFMLLVAPVVLTFSRHQEHEADRFALELTHDNRAAATTFVRLQEENLTVPRPGRLYLLWRASHPSLADRVDFANRYRPWEKGEETCVARHCGDSAR